MRLTKLNRSEWLLVDVDMGLYIQGSLVQCQTVLIDDLDISPKEVSLGMAWLESKPEHDTVNFGINLLVTHTSCTAQAAA